MPYDDDEPIARGKRDHPTLGRPIFHPKQGEEVGYRLGNQWILYKVFEIHRAPEPGSMSGGLYTLRTSQPHFKGDNIISATREEIQFPPAGQGALQWGVVPD